MKHKNTQPLYIFKRENPQNSEPENGPRSGLDYIALYFVTLPTFLREKKISHVTSNQIGMMGDGDLGTKMTLPILKHLFSRLVTISSFVIQLLYFFLP